MTTTPRPKVLPVVVGTIEIYKDILDVGSVSELTNTLNKVQELLSLIPDKDKEDAEFEDCYCTIQTDDKAALSYALKNYFLSDYCTCIDSLVVKYGDDVDEPTLDLIIDENSERRFEVEELEEGLFVVFKD